MVKNAEKYKEEDEKNRQLIEAKNELDNVRVSLTVRELLDLVGKGSATASLLKVKQLADTHKQKMDQNKQKIDAAQQEQASSQQEAQQGMMGGGIYPTPMGG
jgi:molecular chaperone DnaK (HSP70)